MLKPGIHLLHLHDACYPTELHDKLHNSDKGDDEDSGATVGNLHLPHGWADECPNGVLDELRLMTLAVARRLETDPKN